MKAAIAKHPLVAFFSLAFLLSWMAVIPLVLDPSLAPEPFLILGALVGPTLSSLVVIAIVEGRQALRRFFARYLQWRTGIIWWLIVLFGPLIALTIVAAVAVGAEVVANFTANLGLVLSTFLFTLVAGVILGPLWEEPGWRGFALPRLQHRYGPLVGTLILGALWAMWHIPGFFGGWLEGSPWALLISSLAFSILMTWVYNNTRSSILLMILLHSSSNAATAVGVHVLPASMPEMVGAMVNNGWIPAITYSIAAVIVVLATRGRLAFAQD